MGQPSAICLQKNLLNTHCQATLLGQLSELVIRKEPSLLLEFLPEVALLQVTLQGER